MAKTIHSDVSGHTLYAEQISPNMLPGQLEDPSAYNRFWAVHNCDKNGVVFMYLGKGDPKAEREIVVWYARTGALWSGYGETLKEAIEGAQKDGWLYA